MSGAMRGYGGAEDEGAVAGVCRQGKGKGGGGGELWVAIEWCVMERWGCHEEQLLVYDGNEARTKTGQGRAGQAREGRRKARQGSSSGRQGTGVEGKGMMNQGCQLAGLLAQGDLHARHGELKRGQCS